MQDKAITYMPERGNTSLRIVDPYTDPGVWCIVDEGANSNTHGELWLQNAKEKWALKGVRPVLKDATPTSFTGVGTKASSGSYMLPTGFRLKQSNLIVPGYVVSHEMPGSSHPMLLSQQAQSMLGFKKDVRDGTIKMKDYDHQDLEVVRQERTGLFMIRMDHIDVHRCAELWQNSPRQSRMLINGPWKIAPPLPDEREEEVETSTPENDEEVEASTPDRNDIDWTAHVAHPDPKRWDKHDLSKPVLIVSVGLLNFEDSSYSNGTSHDFIKFYRHKFGNGKPYGGFLTNDRQGAGIADHASQNFGKADKLSFLIAHWLKLTQVTTVNFEDTRDDIGTMLKSLSIIHVSENSTKT